MKFALQRLLLFGLLSLAPARAIVVTSNTNVTIPTLRGYTYKAAGLGTWGGATVTLQTYVDSTWTNIPNAAYTADFEMVRTNAGGREMRAVVTGSSGTTSISVSLAEVVGTTINTGGGSVSGISDVPGLQTALDGRVATSALSSANGGANKVLQFDSSGNLRLSPVTNDNVIMNPGGIVWVSDKRGFNFTNQAGVIVGQLYSWGDHNGSQNELILQSQGRLATIAYGGTQTAPNDAARYQRYTEFNSGYAAANPADSTRMPSSVLFLQTRTWNGSASVSNDIAVQAKALDGTGTNSIINIYASSAKCVGGFQVRD